MDLAKTITKPSPGSRLWRGAPLPVIVVTADKNPSSGPRTAAVGNTGGWLKGITSTVSDWTASAAAFGLGVADAWLSDNMGGAGRHDPNTLTNHGFAAMIGHEVGDALAVLTGIGEIAAGAGGEVLGAMLDATGVGLPAGLALNVGSLAVVTHGALTVATAAQNLFSAENVNDGYNDGNSSVGSSNNASNGNGFGESKRTSSKSPPPFVKKGKFTKRNGKWGWEDKSGNFITKGDKPGEWHVHPHPNNKKPLWQGQKPRRTSKQPYWNVNDQGQVTH